MSDLTTRCSNSCPSCGKLHDFEKELEAHDWIRCWNETQKCPFCGGLHGYDWDSDPLFKICNRCGYKWSKI